MKYRISTTAGLILTLLVALFVSSPVRAADEEPIFLYSVCYKAQPGKRAELQEFLTETAPNSNHRLESSLRYCGAWSTDSAR